MWGALTIYQKVMIPWVKTGNKKFKEWEVTLLGRINIDGDTLSVEVNSVQRANKIRTEIERKLKDQVTHQSTSTQSAQELMKQGKLPRSMHQDERKEDEDKEWRESPEFQARLRQMMEARWNNWLKEKIPALGNNSPVQAVKEADGREMVESLLIEYERSETSPSPGYRTDFNSLRERLGLVNKSS